MCVYDLEIYFLSNSIRLFIFEPVVEMKFRYLRVYIFVPYVWVPAYLMIACLEAIYVYNRYLLWLNCIKKTYKYLELIFLTREKNYSRHSISTYVRVELKVPLFGGFLMSVNVLLRVLIIIQNQMSLVPSIEEIIMF